MRRPTVTQRDDRTERGLLRLIGCTFRWSMRPMEDVATSHENRETDLLAVEAEDELTLTATMRQWRSEMMGGASLIPGMERP